MTGRRLVAVAVLAVAVERAFELIFLPIPSELSSVPDIEGDGLSFIAAFVALWAALPAALAFGLPVYHAALSFSRARVASNDCGGAGALGDDRDVDYVRASLAVHLIGFSAWGLDAVLVLRQHRSAAVAEHNSGSTAATLCKEGPFAISRHPINLGLVATASAFAGLATADNFSPLLTVAGAVLFVLHLARKMTDEDAWLANHFNAEPWNAYAAATPLMGPAWLLALAFAPLIVAVVYSAAHFFPRRQRTETPKGV